MQLRPEGMGATHLRVQLSPLDAIERGMCGRSTESQPAEHRSKAGLDGRHRDRAVVTDVELDLADAAAVMPYAIEHLDVQHVSHEQQVAVRLPVLHDRAGQQEHAAAVNLDPGHQRRALGGVRDHLGGATDGRSRTVDEPNSQESRQRREHEGNATEARTLLWG